MLYPEIVGRSCERCLKYQFQDTEDAMAPGPYLLGDGTEMLRPKGSQPPCHACPKQPQSVIAKARNPTTAIEPTEQSFLAMSHYNRSKAVGQFGFVDGIIRKNAEICATVREIVGESKQNRMMMTLAAMMRGVG